MQKQRVLSFLAILVIVGGVAWAQQVDEVTSVTGNFGAPTGAYSDPSVAEGRVKGAPDQVYIQIADYTRITMAFDSCITVDSSLSTSDMVVDTFDLPFPAAAKIEVSADGQNWKNVSGRALNDCNQSRNKVYDDVCTPGDDCSPGVDGTKAYIDLTQTALAAVCYVQMTDYDALIDGENVYPELGFDLDAIYAGSQRFSNCSPVDTVEVEIDIKPGSDPNCFNINGHGIIPVAINGSASFDVSDIDISTLIFAGLEVRAKGNGAPQCSFQDWNGDGYEDLVCQFVDNPDFWNPGIGEATLTGELFDGRLFDGTDYICVQPGW